MKADNLFLTCICSLLLLGCIGRSKTDVMDNKDNFLSFVSLDMYKEIIANDIVKKSYSILDISLQIKQNITEKDNYEDLFIEMNSDEYLIHNLNDKEYVSYEINKILKKLHDINHNLELNTILIAKVKGNRYGEKSIYKVDNIICIPEILFSEEHHSLMEEQLSEQIFLALGQQYPQLLKNIEGIFNLKRIDDNYLNDTKLKERLLHYPNKFKQHYFLDSNPKLIILGLSKYPEFQPNILDYFRYYESKIFALEEPFNRNNIKLVDRPDYVDQYLELHKYVAENTGNISCFASIMSQNFALLLDTSKHSKLSNEGRVLLANLYDVISKYDL